MIRINGGEATLGANTFTGAQVAPSLALGGATIGSNALAVTGTATFSGALTYGGVTLSNSVTGTGSMVLSASPTLTGTLTAAGIYASGNITNSDGQYIFTPYNGATNTGLVRAGVQFDGSSQSMNIYTNNTYRGGWGSTGVLTLGAALNYGGVTLSNSVTGTGSMVLSASPTLTGQLAIGNTLNSVSPTSPNRTITMVVNGVTVYIACKTTND